MTFRHYNGVYLYSLFLDSSVDLFILKTFSLSDFRCYKDHECSYAAAMVGGLMLCGVGSILFLDNSLVQSFVSSRLSV